MDLREALQTSARRFCKDRHSHWAETYRRLVSDGGSNVSADGLNWTFTQQAYATFPRYLAWQAILDEVERLETWSAPTLDALRGELAAAGWRAKTMLTANPELPPAARAAMDEERETFAHFVRSITVDELESVEPLALRRVFGKEELNRAWQRLDEVWDVKLHHYWWPLREDAAPFTVLPFHEDWFDEEKITVLRELLLGTVSIGSGNSESSASGAASSRPPCSSPPTPAKRATGRRQRLTGLFMPRMSPLSRSPANGCWRAFGSGFRRATSSPMEDPCLRQTNEVIGSIEACFIFWVEGTAFGEDSNSLASVRMLMHGGFVGRVHRSLWSRLGRARAKDRKKAAG